MCKNVDVSLFADDKMLFSASQLIKTIVNRLQKALDQNRKYFHRWKIKLNEGKTKAIIFSKRRPHINKNSKISDQSIPWSDKVKYLGIILNKRLNFSKHVNKIISKSIAKLVRLYPIFNKNSHFSVKNKLMLFKSVIRPAITYACPVWNYISKSTFDKIQIVQVLTINW